MNVKYHFYGEISIIPLAHFHSVATSGPRTPHVTFAPVNFFRIVPDCADDNTMRHDFISAYADVNPSRTSRRGKERERERKILVDSHEWAEGWGRNSHIRSNISPTYT